MVTSRPLVGSSASTTLGSQTSAIATTTRWTMPPRELVRIGAHSLPGIGNPDRSQHLRRPLPCFVARRPVVREVDVGDLPAHRQHRIEMDAGVLDDDPYLPAPERAQLIAIKVEDAPARERDRAAGDPPRIRHGVHEGSHEERFADPALPDHPKGFPPADVEGDVVESANRSRP